MAAQKYPEDRSKVQVAVQTGYAATGGGFNSAFRLRTLELVQGRGDLRASDNLSHCELRDPSPPSGDAIRE